MKKEMKIREILLSSVQMTPEGFTANEMSVEQFTSCYTLFFDEVLKIHKANINELNGFGEFDEECKTSYLSCKDFLVGTFDNEKDGYWYHWKEMFETKILDENFFDTYFTKMQNLIPYCEKQRYLVYNNTFFANMITDGKTKVGFPDWSRAGIADWLLDFAIMDLNKPYLEIPEKLSDYCKEKNIVIEHFMERFLCMAYYKGLDTLRWHASIEDTESVKSIMESMVKLEGRLMNI